MKTFFSLSAMAFCFSFTFQNTNLQTGLYFVIEKNNDAVILINEKDTIYIAKNPIVTSSDFTKTTTIKSREGFYAVKVILNADGIEKSKTGIVQGMEKKIAFVANGKLVSLSLWNITEDGFIIGWCSSKDIAEKLEKEITTKH